MNPDDARLIERAHAVAEHWHRGQTRKSGDPYVTHPVTVATKVAALGADVPTICAALLHDVLEDSACPVDALRHEFGDEIVRLVLDLMRLDRADQATIAAVDQRALTIKLADRLHNMQTLRHVDRAKQIRKARETLDVIAPLADVLGFFDVRSELERLALAWLFREGVARKVLTVGSALLPFEVRARWLEEWAGELHSLPTRRHRARFTLQVLAGLPKLAFVLRRPL